MKTKIHFYLCDGVQYIKAVKLVFQCVSRLLYCFTYSVPSAWNAFYNQFYFCEALQLSNKKMHNKLSPCICPLLYYEILQRKDIFAFPDSGVGMNQINAY